MDSTPIQHEPQDLGDKMVGLDQVTDPRVLGSWGAFLDHSGVGAWVCDLISGQIRYSKGWADMLGLTPEELLAMEDPWTELIHPDDRAKVIALHLEHVDAASGYYECEQRLKHKDGRYRWVLSRCRVELDRKGRALESCGYQIDITELKERAISNGTAGLSRAAFLQQAPVHIAVFDRDVNEFVYWSRQEDAESVWRVIPREKEGELLVFLAQGEPGDVLSLSNGSRGEEVELYELDQEEGNLVGLIIRPKPAEAEKLEKATSLIGTIHSKKRVLRSENNSLESLAMTLQDARTRLERLSQVDSLTGLLNRRAFDERLEDMLERGQGCSVVLMDIDHFKKINDTLGHPVGDIVLRESARTLRSFVQPGQELARIGGEEFAWLIPDRSRSRIFRVADEARQCFESESWVCGTLTISGGIAHAVDGDNASSLLSRADQALYAAKRGGRNRIEVADKPILRKAA